jgi:hypothetical protein
MTYRGVGRPVTEMTPDGPVTVLPLQLWRENLDEIEEHPADFRTWEAEHYAVGPRRAAQGRNGSAVADCSNCVTPQYGRKVYCGFHRCRGTNADGTRCKQAANETHGGLYCKGHGCTEIIVPHIGCCEPSEPGRSRCAAHRLPEAPPIQAW